METRHPGFLDDCVANCLNSSLNELNTMLASSYMNLFRSEKQMFMMAGHSYDEWQQYLEGECGYDKRGSFY